MFSKTVGFAVLTLMSVLFWTSAPTATMIYYWHDASGATFTDDPTNVPNDARVVVMADQAPAPLALKPTPPPTESRVVTEEPSQVATQGAFVVQLVEELGLREEPSEDEAADLLTDLRITPRLGEWALDSPMTPDLAQRLRQLTVAAATSGRMTLTPEQSLLAFDTAAALMGVALPEPGELDGAAAQPYPMATAPPLVEVTYPPADLYPYYLWVPVAGGFWCNNVLVSGFFVLDAPRYFHHRHSVAMTPDHIGRHFRSHVTGTPRGFTPARRPPHRGYSSGGRVVGVQPDRHIVAPRSASAPTTSRSRAMRPHPVNRMGRTFQLPSGAIRSEGTPTPRSSDSSMRRGFSSGGHRGGLGPGLQFSSFRSLTITK